MKRALIICLFCAISINVGINEGYCATTLFPPLQPLQPIGASNSTITNLEDPFAKSPYQEQSPSPYLADAGVNYPRISEIERSLYGQIFTAQDILLRLARIEKSIFSTSYPRMTLAERVDNIVMNFNQINKCPNISKNTLSAIENKVLKKNYSQNDVENRIERLEQQIFGASQSGELTSRFETLKAAAKDYNPNPYMNDYNQNPFANTPKNGGLRNVVRNLGNMMMGGGMMTGFSPSIVDPFNGGNNGCNNAYGNNNSNSYNNNANNGLYSNGYNGNSNNGLNNFASVGSPNGYGQYNGYSSNHGYSDAFKSYGAGSRVTILD